MQIWAESGKSALPICNYSQILYQFLTFTQNLKRSQFFFFQCRLLNYFVHGTIPRYSFFYCSFCLPLHFEISKQFFLLPIISFMKLSNNSFGLLRFSLQSLNLFSYDIWNCTI